MVSRSSSKRIGTTPRPIAGPVSRPALVRDLAEEFGVVARACSMRQVSSCMSCERGARRGQR